MNGQTTPKRFNPRPGQNRIPRSPKLTRTTPQDSATKSILDRDDEYSSPLKTPTKPLTAEGETNQQRTTPARKRSPKKEIRKPVKGRNLASESNFIKQNLEDEKLGTDSGSIKPSKLNLSSRSHVRSLQKASSANEAEVDPGQVPRFQKSIRRRPSLEVDEPKSHQSRDENQLEVESPSDLVRQTYPPDSGPNLQNASSTSESSESEDSTSKKEQTAPLLPAKMQKTINLELEQFGRRRGISMRDEPKFGSDNSLSYMRRRIILLQFVLDSNGVFTKTWASINTILLICVGIFAPIRAGIMKDETSNFIYIFEKVTDAFFFADIVINFFTPVDVDGDKVSELAGIARHYLRSWFTIDLVSCLPLDEIFKLIGVPARWAVYSRLLRGLKLLRLFKVFQSTEKENIGSDNYLIAAIWHMVDSVVKFTCIVWSFWVMLATHIASCYWHWLGTYNDQRSWRNRNNFGNESDLDLYITSLYFVTQTITSTGYGDITSERNREICFRIFVMLFGNIMYSMFSGKLSQPISDSFGMNYVVILQLQALKRVSIAYKLDRQTRRRIVENINFKLQKDYQNAKIQTSDDLVKLFKNEHVEPWQADQLCYRYCTEAYGKLRGMPLFRPFSSASDPDSFNSYSFYIKRLFNSMKERRFEAGEPVYFKGESARLFYIIESGSVGFYQTVFGEEVIFSKVCIRKPDQHRVKSTFQEDEKTVSLEATSDDNFHSISANYLDGGYFGEIELMDKEDKRLFTVKTLKRSVIHAVGIEEFNSIFCDHQKDRYLARSMKQKCANRKLVINKNLEEFKERIISMLKTKINEAVAPKPPRTPPSSPQPWSSTPKT